MPRLVPTALLVLGAAALSAGAAAAQSGGAAAGFDLAARRAAHWAWQPLGDPAPPPAPAGAAVREPIDAFVAAALAARGLRPSPPAPPHLLLRRLWLDLAGLPPPAATAQAFAADPSEAAYDRQVDELLASPAHAERWARHWLDLVRYAETLGHEFDFPLPNAWRYRDYVVRAVHQDVPYDQFVRELIAGDLLDPPRRAADGSNESVLGTAAWWFVEQAHAPVDPARHRADRIDNQLDVLGKAVLGLTVACARCHDHKFDAISSADYYALAGFVRSSRYVQAPLRPADGRGPAFAAALAAQGELAAATAAAAAAPAAPGTDAARWAALAGRAPADWDGGWAPPPLRPGEQLVAAADGPAADWSTTNDGFGAAPHRGPWCRDPATGALQLLPGPWWHSGRAGRGRDGGLQTRTFALTADFVHVLVAGEGSRLALVVDGLQLVRAPIYGDCTQRVDRAEPHWLTVPVAGFRGRSAWLQGLDQRAHDLADAHRDRGSWPDDAWLAVQRVVLSPHREPPPLPAAAALPALPWTAPPPAVAAALADLGAAQAALPPPSPTAPALQDGTGEDEPLCRRGDHRQPGPRVARRFLAALAGEAPLAIPSGSGRQQLAAALLAADDPLPARALANRVWQHLFGRGLVRSADNLGALGDPPSHPELLDWLARDLQRHGWSQRHLIRRIVRSATYRQDSRERPDAAAVDPDNRWLHRQNVRRLEAEPLRDSLLALGGRLDPQLGGPPVPVPIDPTGRDARGRPPVAGPLDGDGRRSLYLAVQRNFLPSLLLAFDLPTPFATVATRSSANVPAQALALRNDPFVWAMAEQWARALGALPAEERLATAFWQAFARPPSATERAAAAAFLASAPAAGATADGALAELLHALFATKEFRYRR